MPRYVNTARHPINLSDGSVVGVGETFDTTADPHLGVLVDAGHALLVTDKGNPSERAVDYGVASEEAIEPVGVLQHDPTPEQAAAQAAHDRATQTQEEDA